MCQGSKGKGIPQQVFSYRAENKTWELDIKSSRSVHLTVAYLFLCEKLLLNELEIPAGAGVYYKAKSVGKEFRRDGSQYPKEMWEEVREGYKRFSVAVLGMRLEDWSLGREREGGES